MSRCGVDDCDYAPEDEWCPLCVRARSVARLIDEADRAGLDVRDYLSDKDPWFVRDEEVADLRAAVEARKDSWHAQWERSVDWKEWWRL